jgi:hypothetical protein
VKSTGGDKCEDTSSSDKWLATQSFITLTPEEKKKRIWRRGDAAHNGPVAYNATGLSLINELGAFSLPLCCVVVGNCRSSTGRA